jgi:type II secretory pathway component PulJ
MGSQVVLDLIASSLTFGTLLLMAIRLNGTVAESMQMYNGDILVQNNIVTVVNMIEYDFRKIGYCADPSQLPDPTKAIILADSNRIKFYTDLATSSYPNGDGVLDIVYYYLGPTSELSSTPNPNDRILYRVVNNAPPKGANLGVTQFSLLYFSAFGDTLPFPITNPGQIWAMQITVQVENSAADSLRYNTAKFDTQYSQAFWRQVRLASMNLKNR